MRWSSDERIEVKWYVAKHYKDVARGSMNLSTPCMWNEEKKYIHPSVLGQRRALKTRKEREARVQF